MKLSGWVWLFVGFCLSAIIIAYGFFQHYQPNMAERDVFNASAEKYKPLADKNTERKALARVQAAQSKVDAAAAQWNGLVAVKTPPKDVRAGGINLDVNRVYLTMDAPKFRNSVQRAVNAQLLKGGVTVVTGVSVPQPPTEYGQLVEGYFNYPAYPFPVCIYEFGTVTVEGTYDQILRNVRGWSDMPNYVAVTDGLQITGTSPKLTATYTLTVVAMIRGDKISPPVGDATPGAAAAPAAAPAGGPPARPTGGRALGGAR